MTKFNFLFCILLSFSCFAQVEYKTEILKPIPISESIDMSVDVSDFNPVIKFNEIHPPGNSTLDDIKYLVEKKYPRKPELAINRKGLADPPVVINGFSGNSFQGNTPLDNHMCVSNDGQILAAINSNVNMRMTDGTLIRNKTLETFTGEVAEGVQKYDPRVHYDPVADRFIFVCLAGFASTTSKVVVGFSQTSDVNGEWNFYELDGNPKNNAKWTDYPMISISENEFFLTVNLLADNESWQLGFSETLIYQIDLPSAYNGEELKTRMWSDITYDGKPIRNLCPVKYADERTSDRMFFLSNRNFAVSNDTIFVLELNHTQEDPNVSLDINLLKSNVPYGAPPDAQEAIGRLQTNDARVLDAILIDEQIQFVGNTRNDTTGYVDVYHGIIDDIDDTRTINAAFVGNGDYDLAYPGIAWTGASFDAKDVIIMATHTGVNKFAGISAVYYDIEGDYSDVTTIKEGDNTINDANDRLRWGDYSGIQRQYDNPGYIFTAATFGGINQAPFTWINRVAAPGLDMSNTEEYIQDNQIDIYPNPSAEKAFIKFEITKYAQIDISLFDINGQKVKTLFKDHPKKVGEVKMEIDLSPLTAGTYFLQARIGDQLIKAKKVVKM